MLTSSLSPAQNTKHDRYAGVQADPFDNRPDLRLNDEPARLAALHRYQILDTPPEQPFDKITELVRSLLGTPMCAVSLVDSERQWFKSSPGLPVFEMARCFSFCSHAIQQNDAFIIEDAKVDHRFRDNPFVLGAPHIGSYAGIPLCTPDGYNIGALCVIDTAPRVFEPAQIDLLRKFAALVMDELELRQAAQRDFLTGVMSRRAFINEASAQIAAHRQEGRTSALIMFDVDHFKSINDTYGHPAGDSVLKEMVARTSAEIGSDDCIGRLGGEEFGVLVSGALLDAAAGLAERIRTSLAVESSYLSEPKVITASFGIAALTDAVGDPTEWIALADAALYRAKAAGRNRCVIA